MNIKLPVRIVRAVAVLALAGRLLAGAWAEPAALSSLGDIAALDKKNSLDHAKAYIAESSALNAIPGVFKFDSSSISTTASYANAPDGTPSLGLSASANVPIIEQVGVSLSIDDSLNASLGASVNPLSHSASRTMALITYEKAQAATVEAGKTAATNAIKAALSWMSQQRKLETVRKDVDLKKRCIRGSKGKQHAPTGGDKYR
jgi:hypothetical protein